jgi:putative endonuclease
MYFVYLLRCKDKSIYTGITNDLLRRLKQHKSGKGGRYTRARGVREIVYTEKYKTRGEALKREAEIKSWRRDRKLSLIKIDERR